MADLPLSVAVDALRYLPASVDRDTWVRYLMAAKASGIDESTARDWSAQADSFNDGAFRSTWRSIKANGPIGPGVLIQEAQKCGFVLPEPVKHANGKTAPGKVTHANGAKQTRAANDENAAALKRKNAEANARALLSKLAQSHARDDHRYLVMKGVRAVAPTLFEIESAAKLRPIIGYVPKGDGETLQGRTLVAPIYSAADPHHLASLEFIDEQGRKSALAGGAKSGGAWCAMTPELAQHTRYIVACEGAATALSIAISTGAQTFAALSCTNLLKVAKALRSHHPEAALVIAGDIGNGQADAAKAAQAVGGYLALPDFGAERTGGQSDFNDLHQARGADVVRAAIEAALVPHAKPEASEPGAEPVRTESDEQAFARLAALAPMAYDRARKTEAEALGVRPATLDKMVAKVRGEADSEESAPFEEVEPWPQAVDGAHLLNEIAQAIRRFVVCDPETTAAVALWCTAAWFVEQVGVCPILLVNAPEKACGKTQLLSIAGRLVPRPAQAAHISPSVLFRLIQKYQPTLLIDEIETVLTREAEDLRGLMNAGHSRDSAYVWRSVPVGDDFEPRRFRVYGFKALAGINADRLAETITSRSIIANLRRKLPDEKVERLRHAPPGLFDDLRAQLARWAEDHAEAMRAARPGLPDALDDRQQDNWEPLLAVADLAGGTWPQYARAAALKLCGGTGEASKSAGAELLADIRAVFERLRERRISMVDLLRELLADDDAPWQTWNHGKPMTSRQLGRKLSEYGIKSQTVKIGYDAPKGYKIEQFGDAFARYLSLAPVTPLSSVTQSPPNIGAGFEVTEARLPEVSKTPSVTLNPLSHKEGDQVTDGKGGEGQKRKIHMVTEAREAQADDDEAEGDV